MGLTLVGFRPGLVLIESGLKGVCLRVLILGLRELGSMGRT